MTTILLIRHGDNESLSKYLPGHLTGIHLNEAGKTQALLVADSLKDVQITSIISSPLERAVETATPLAEKLHLSVDIQKGFIEMNTGSWTGKNFTEIKEDPVWKKLRDDPENHTFPDGETFADAQMRLWDALKNTIDIHDDNATVAIFSHSDCIKLLLAKAMDAPMRRYYSFSVDPASLSILIFKKNRIYLDGLNLKLPYQWQPRLVSSSNTKKSKD
jgi:broad specificity phosphatase PhoE